MLQVKAAAAAKAEEERAKEKEKEIKTIEGRGGPGKSANGTTTYRWGKEVLYTNSILSDVIEAIHYWVQLNYWNFLPQEEIAPSTSWHFLAQEEIIPQTTWHFLSLDEIIPCSIWHFLSQDEIITCTVWNFSPLREITPHRILHNLSLEENIFGMFFNIFSNDSFHICLFVSSLVR